MNSPFALLACFAVALTLLASTCHKEQFRKDVLDHNTQPVRITNQVLEDSLTCYGLAVICPKLFRLAREYPPRPNYPHNPKTYLVHPELVSYFLDSLADYGQYRHDLPVVCPGITRQQIECAIGLPPKTEAFKQIDTRNNVRFDVFMYDFARDPQYGLEQSTYWREPIYMAHVWYYEDSTLAYINHNGL